MKIMLLAYIKEVGGLWRLIGGGRASRAIIRGVL
jgi:hypothetical protein